METPFIKRFKSLIWRAGMMVAALVVDFVIQNLTSFNLPPLAVVSIGLVLGEVSKHLNNVLSQPVDTIYGPQ